MDPTRLALVIAFSLLATFWAVAPDASAQGTYSLSGTVCPGPGGEDQCWQDGLANATVTVTKHGAVDALDESETMETAEGGSYSFGGLSSGEWDLTVTRTAFEDYATTLVISSDTKHDVVMTGKEVTVSGQVLSEGEAVDNAHIRAYGDPEYAEAESGSDGAFQLTVVAGHYHVEVEAAGYRSVSTYRLLDGQESLSFELEAIPPPSIPVTGTVTDKAGLPVSGAKVVASQYGHHCCYDEPVPMTEPAPDGAQTDAAYSPPYYGGDDHFETTTDATGKYSLEVRQGWVDLRITKDGFTQYQTGFDAREGQSYQKDATIKEIPEKTVRIAGGITDSQSGDRMRYVSVSLQNLEYGVHECSRYASDGSGGGTSGTSPGSPGMAEGDEDGVSHSSVVEPRYYDDGCAIVIQADGTFTANVTPGYTIINVYYEQWRACQERQDQGGSFSRECGPEYFSYSETLKLEEDSAQRLDVGLRQRPGPDATVSGYVVDAEKQIGVSDARISFSHQDSYAHGWASTDGDGSYKVRVRSGYHHVSVWADGFLRWEGVLHVAAGAEKPFDVMMQAGQEQYGGCCYGYPEPVPYAAGDYAEDSAGYDGEAVSDETLGAAGAPSRSGADGSDGAQESAAGGQDFQDLGGGLGPYDPDARAKELAGSDSNLIPGPATVLLVIGLLGMVAGRRLLRP